MLYTKFQASEASGSEEEDFWIISMYFYGSNPVPLGAGQLWILKSSFEKNLVIDH